MSSINVKTKMNNQSTAAESIKRRQFIVGSVDPQGNFSIASKPATHLTNHEAMQECRRLATLKPGMIYVAMQLAGAAVVNSVQFL